MHRFFLCPSEVCLFAMYVLMLSGLSRFAFVPKCFSALLTNFNVWYE